MSFGGVKPRGNVQATRARWGMKEKGRESRRGANRQRDYRIRQTQPSRTKDSLSKTIRGDGSRSQTIGGEKKKKSQGRRRRKTSRLMECRREGDSRSSSSYQREKKVSIMVTQLQRKRWSEARHKGFRENEKNYKGTRLYGHVGG